MAETTLRPEQDLVIGLDQGTTGNTVLVLDRNLDVVAKATEEFPQHFPQPGWVEHDADEIWASMRRALARALDGIDRRRLAAVGITNQRETTFVWDIDTHAMLRRAIVWQDRRTSDICAGLKGHEERVRELTGLPIDPYFSATKVAWMRRRHPRANLLFGTADSHLVRRLTGATITDVSNASRTLLLDLERGTWSDELAEIFGVLDVQRPPVVPSSERALGRIVGVPELPDGLVIAGIAGDQQAALFGQGCFDAGTAKITYGTGSFVLMNTGTKPVRSRHGLVSTIAWQLGGRGKLTYALEGGSFVAGALIQWLRDGLGIIEQAPDVEALAASVPDAGGVTVVPALAGLGAPHWRPEARGVIHGITRGTTKAHIARAALEGIAHSQCDILEAMAADLGTTHGGKPLTELGVDGGAAANDLLMQIQSDLSGLALKRPRMLETTALGAAMLAGLGVGLWKSLDELRRSYPLERRFTPQRSGDEVAAARARWRAAIEKA